MLSHDLSWYLLKILSVGIWQPWGLASIALFVSLLFLPRLLRSQSAGLRSSVMLLVVFAAFACLTTTVYKSEYSFDESDNFMAETKTFPDDADCGQKWDVWQGGWGLANTCGKGCYRGATLEKKMRLTGFPPRPLYQRKVQCWERSENFPLY